MTSAFSFSLEQWLFVALVFVAGWLLGLASHAGGKKWRERYAAEREAHAQTRKAADARVATAEASHAELTREHDRLRAAAPVTAQTVAPARTVAARPAYAPGERRGWFDWGTRRT